MPTHAMNFLSRQGLFANANARIPDAPFNVLESESNKFKQKKDINQAILYAQKASIQYGLEGLMLYFPLALKWLEDETKNGEIIEQPLVKTIALIMFAERNCAQNKSEENQFAILDNHKKQLLSMSDNSSDIEDEAGRLAFAFSGWNR